MLGDSGMNTLYLISGLVMYMVLLALITKVLKQNSVTPELAHDRRVADRRQSTEPRRKGQRSERGESRRMGDRRSMYAGAPA